MQNENDHDSLFHHLDLSGPKVEQFQIINSDFETDKSPKNNIGISVTRKTWILRQLKPCKWIFWISFGIFINFITIGSAIKYFNLTPAIDIRIHFPERYFHMNVTLSKAIEVIIKPG